MKKIISFCVLLLCLFSFTFCASVHEANYAAEVVDNGTMVKTGTTGLGLLISGEENQKMASRNFGVIEFTFENTTDKWVRINKISVDFGDEAKNSSIFITSGRDIDIWKESIMIRNRIDEYNMNLFLGTLAVLGTAAAVGSNNQSVQNAGAAAALGAFSSLAVRDFLQYRDKIQGTAIFPSGHLFSDGFNVPPGLFVKKWILLNSRNHKDIGFINKIFLTYETDDKKSETVRLVFRERYRDIPHTSSWQNDIYDR